MSIAVQVALVMVVLLVLLLAAGDAARSLILLQED